MSKIFRLFVLLVSLADVSTVRAAETLSADAGGWKDAKVVVTATNPETARSEAIQKVADLSGFTTWELVTENDGRISIHSGQARLIKGLYLEEVSVVPVADETELLRYTYRARYRIEPLPAPKPSDGEITFAGLPKQDLEARLNMVTADFPEGIIFVDVLAKKWTKTATEATLTFRVGFRVNWEEFIRRATLMRDALREAALYRNRVSTEGKSIKIADGQTLYGSNRTLVKPGFIDRFPALLGDDQPEFSHGVEVLIYRASTDDALEFERLFIPEVSVIAPLHVLSTKRLAMLVTTFDAGGQRIAEKLVNLDDGLTKVPPFIGAFPGFVLEEEGKRVLFWPYFTHRNGFRTLRTKYGTASGKAQFALAETERITGIKVTLVAAPNASPFEKE